MLNLKEMMYFMCGYSIFAPKNCETNTTSITNSGKTRYNAPIHLNEANEIPKKVNMKSPILECGLLTI